MSDTPTKAQPPKITSIEMLIQAFHDKGYTVNSGSVEHTVGNGLVTTKTKVLVSAKGAAA